MYFSNTSAIVTFYFSNFIYLWLEYGYEIKTIQILRIATTTKQKQATNLPAIDIICNQISYADSRTIEVWSILVQRSEFRLFEQNLF